MEFYSPSQPETRESQAHPHLARPACSSSRSAGCSCSSRGRCIWIIRTLIEYRRWNRTSKVHTEVHNKLMDRFTANEDLLAYMQTPAAQRFLESAPLSLDAPARPVGAPLSRILWSVQVGVVLAAGGARVALRQQPGDRGSGAAALCHRRARAGGRRRLRRVGRRVIPPVAPSGPLRPARPAARAHRKRGALAMRSCVI